MNTLAQLSQTELWATKPGETVKLRTMSRPQKKALLDQLRATADTIVDQVLTDVVTGRLAGAPLGSHAGMTAAAIIDEIEAAPTARAWVDAQPLTQALDADVNILAGLRKKKAGTLAPAFL